MDTDRCKYSEVTVAWGTVLPDYTQRNLGDGLTLEQWLECNYIECPECGAIRTVKKIQVGTGPGSKVYCNYPVHNTLMGTTRTRAQWWKKIQGKNEWKLEKP